MAININATLTTDEGFEVTNPWAYVDIYLIGDNWANVRYYKSKSDYQQGFQPLNINTLPSRVSTDIDNSKFWGTQLADDCGNCCNRTDNRSRNLHDRQNTFRRVMTKYTDTTAKVLTATSAGGWIVSLSDYQPLVSFIGGIIAIISGLLAIRYYYIKTKKLK